MSAVLDARRRGPGDARRRALGPARGRRRDHRLPGSLLDAASRGLRAALVERDDIAVGDQRPVVAADPRRAALSRAVPDRARPRGARRASAGCSGWRPHLVRIEPFVFPLYGGPLTRPFYDAGLTLYDLLGAASDGGWHRHLSVEEALETTPVLRHERPARRVRLPRRPGGRRPLHPGRRPDGAGRAARSPLTRVTRHRRAPAGRADRRRGGPRRAERRRLRRPRRAGRRRDRRLVGSCRRAVPGRRRPGPVVRPSRGTHLIVRRDRIPSALGLTLRVPGRVCFLVPWPDHWVIGTTDLDDDGPAGPAGADERRGRRDPRNVNATLDVDLDRADLVGAYAGLRPLATDPGGTRLDRQGVARASDPDRAERPRPDRRRQVHDLPADGGPDASTPRSVATSPGRARRGRDRAAARRRGAADGARRAGEPRSPPRPGWTPRRAERLVARHGTEAADVVALGASSTCFGRSGRTSPTSRPRWSGPSGPRPPCRSTTSSPAGPGWPRSWPTVAAVDRRGSPSWSAPSSTGRTRARPPRSRPTWRPRIASTTCLAGPPTVPVAAVAHAEPAGTPRAGAGHRRAVSR